MVSKGFRCSASRKDVPETAPQHLLHSGSSRLDGPAVDLKYKKKLARPDKHSCKSSAPLDVSQKSPERPVSMCQLAHAPNWHLHMQPQGSLKNRERFDSSEAVAWHACREFGDAGTPQHSNGSRNEQRLSLRPNGWLDRLALHKHQPTQKGSRCARKLTTSACHQGCTS